MFNVTNVGRCWNRNSMQHFSCVYNFTVCPCFLFRICYGKAEGLGVSWLTSGWGNTYSWIWPGTLAQYGRDSFCHYNRATCLMMLLSSWSGYRSRCEYSRRVAAINFRCSMVQCRALKLVMESQISVAYFDSVKSVTCLLPSCTIGTFIHVFP